MRAPPHPPRAAALQPAGSVDMFLDSSSGFESSVLAGAGATSGAAVLVALERELEVCETQLLELSACARARGALSRANVAS